jgi:hypothetical protein
LTGAMAARATDCFNASIAKKSQTLGGGGRAGFVMNSETCNARSRGFPTSLQGNLPPFGKRTT